MIAISRFRVPEERADEFVSLARAAIDALAQADGFLTGDLGRNLDEPTLWTVSTRWKNVGSYRRGLGSYQSRMAAVPLLALAIDEPSAYEDPVNLEL